MPELIKTGDTVRIIKCEWKPRLVGQSAEVLDLPGPKGERYRIYPVSAKMLSGEFRGKLYGFDYDELEVIPKETKPIAPRQEIPKSATRAEDIADIERAINEAKGKIRLEPVLGSWEGKTPCWETFHCPEAVRNGCPAFHYRSLPCWQIEGTYSKLHDDGASGGSTEICENCRVYKRYGHGEPIEIRLRGRGLKRAEK
jgi:hypothetical protein